MRTLHHPASLLLALSLALGACEPQQPPEAPPPAGCGPGMTEVQPESSGVNFCADVKQVTVADYSECVGRAACSALPRERGCRQDDLATHQQPVNCVDLAQADAFCKWKKKRLPTQQELTTIGAAGVAEQQAGGAEWTSTPWRGVEPQQPQATLMKSNPGANPPYIGQGVAPSNYHTGLGFRCVR